MVDKDKQLVVFKLNFIQQILVSTSWFRNIWLKARQLGITTWACVDGLDDVLFNNDFTMVIIAHDQKAMYKIFKKIKRAWENMDKDLVKHMGWVEVANSSTELSFNNGSSISVALSSRADTVNRLHISEFGKICRKYPDKAEEIITGAIPSVPVDGRIDIESTAEGEYGFFHDMFWEAWERAKKTNEKFPKAKKLFKSHFLSWYQDKGYVLEGDFDLPSDLIEYGKEHKLTREQLNWYFIEMQTQKKKMKQEYPTTPDEAFESSGNKMFDLDMINKLVTREPISIVGDWQYFEKYNPRHRYAIGADVAEGVGQDSSTAVIIDFTYQKPKVVAVFKSNLIAPDTFGYELDKEHKAWGRCIIAPEHNNHGFTTIKVLRDLGANVYFQEEIAKENGVAEVKGINKKPEALRQRTVKYGWNTNGATKPMMMYDLNSAFEDEILEISSEILKKELRSYDKEDLTVIRFSNDQTKHWDLVIALAICWQMRTHLSVPRTQRTAVGLNRASFN